MAEEEKEPQAQDSQVFMIDGQLQDAWGRPADEAEAVEFEENVYQNQTVTALKAELRKRRDAGREFDTGQIKTKRDLVAALAADDIAQRQEAAEQGETVEDDEVEELDRETDPEE